MRHLSSLPLQCTQPSSRQDYTYIQLAKGGNHCAEFGVYHVRSSDTNALYLNCTLVMWQ